jgi:hypothetical protein
MTAFFQEIFQPRADCCFGQAEGFNNFDIHDAASIRIVRNSASGNLRISAPAAFEYFKGLDVRRRSVDLFLHVAARSP